jgi:imidazolonepropionase-like amidohydrolase
MVFSTPRNPYQDGLLAVIGEGAYADLILVSGNRLENINFVADAANNFDVIMKVGVIYKNTIE